MLPSAIRCWIVSLIISREILWRTLVVVESVPREPKSPFDAVESVESFELVEVDEIMLCRAGENELEEVVGGTDILVGVPSDRVGDVNEVFRSGDDNEVTEVEVEVWVTLVVVVVAATLSTALEAMAAMVSMDMSPRSKLGIRCGLSVLVSKERFGGGVSGRSELSWIGAAA